MAWRVKKSGLFASKERFSIMNHHKKAMKEFARLQESSVIFRQVARSFSHFLGKSRTRNQFNGNGIESTKLIRAGHPILLPANALPGRNTPGGFHKRHHISPRHFGLQDVRRGYEQPAIPAQL
jgi:hypothetical protein